MALGIHLEQDLLHCMPGESPRYYYEWKDVGLLCTEIRPPLFLRETGVRRSPRLLLFFLLSMRIVFEGGAPDAVSRSPSL